jgi:sulfur-oxidizing protein SoxY
MDQITDGRRRSRRRTMKALGAVGLAAGALSLGLALPGSAFAQQGLGMPLPDEKVADTLQRLFGGRALQPAGDRITVDAPMIAENGAVVPIKIDANLPMTADNYVKKVYVIADKNRRPLNATFSLTPDAGKASLATNVRLAATSDVRVIAEMSNGSLYESKQEVKVTVGGCGG